MVSEKFRRQLRQEVEQWLAEELIDASMYEQLSNRYQFNELETAARNRFITILLGLGSILLGLGLITFVAANWQAWSRGVKVVLLLSVFIGVSSAGFFLWRRSIDRWQRRLGQGLLLLGGLALGANIALMSQLFHHSGPVYQLYLVWGLGVLAMAYSLRLELLGLLAVLLIGLGYGQGQPDVVAIGEVAWLRLMVQHMPILSGLMFIPLAYWCRSRWLFRIGAIAIIASLEINVLRFNLSNAPAWSAAIACALPPALLWGYRDALWRQHLPSTQSFDPIARSLAIAFLGLLFYVLSFLRLWDTSSVPAAEDASLLPWPFLVDILILGSLTVWEWLRLLGWRQVDRTTTVIGMMIVITALVPYWHLSISRLPAIAVLIFNVFLLLLAIGLVREGLAQGQRRLFWGGMVLLTLQIFSRMLEYNTGLLFKSIVLLLCGFGIITAGLWFERHVRTLSTRN
ncbi:MAG TPA: DUF2157 domain-containing protein [Coleofasciculaceae cyanobacterium]